MVQSLPDPTSCFTGDPEPWLCPLHASLPLPGLALIQDSPTALFLHLGLDLQYQPCSGIPLASGMFGSGPGGQRGSQPDYSLEKHLEPHNTWHRQACSSHRGELRPPDFNQEGKPEASLVILKVGGGRINIAVKEK